MLDHFGQHLRQPQPTSQSSSSTTTFSRPEAISINIFAAILSALRSLAEAKSKLGQDDIKKAAAAIIIGMSNTLTVWIHLCNAFFFFIVSWLNPSKSNIKINVT